ncbi:MAG: prolyl oligopeptidase family serine peptidase, partial [Corynebacterium sp.]|nr:prolyl oligopeptidase family serine peptidase [Corynebacterium sp.]
ARPGGFGGPHLAGSPRGAELEVHSQAADETEHARLMKERTTAKVTAALHSSFPTRYWDHDLGPTRPVLAIAAVPEDLSSAEATPAPGTRATDGTGAGGSAGVSAGGSAGTSTSSDAEGSGGSGRSEGSEDAAHEQVLHFRYVTMPAGRLVEWSVDRTGSRALVAMQDSRGDLLATADLYLLDLIGGQPPRLLREATAEVEFEPGEFSPDGMRVLIGRGRTWTQHASLSSTVEVLDLATGDSVQVWPELDQWVEPIWLDDATLVATSDDQGRGSVWIGGIDDPAPRRLAGGPEQDLAFSSASIAGGAVIAVASGIAVAPHPVRIDPATGAVEELPNPADAVEQVGSLTEITATAEDGTDLRAWLRAPEGDGPHPPVVFAHGGPGGSWNASFTDIMARTDRAVSRDDVDAERTAFAGGSYGGYMANWVAGHTGDRFRCIVTHASLWDTATMGHTTDNAGWERPMREQNARYNPKDSVGDIVAPMLVIHGDRDYRVPIAQGHALWYDLHE